MDYEEFEALCVSYRTWPKEDATGVLERFEELRNFVAEKLIQEYWQGYSDSVGDEKMTCKHGLQTNCHLCKFDRTSQYFWLGYAGIVCIVCGVIYLVMG